MIRFRILFPIMALISVLLILAPLVMGLLSAFITYRGTCYGFTDGSWPCSRWEYTTDTVFWSALLDIPILLYLIPGWFVAVALWLHKRNTTEPHGLPRSLAVLIPISCCLGGTCITTLLPFFIRFFYMPYP
jgi:hypothetical protein